MPENCRIVVRRKMRLFDENVGRRKGSYLLQTGLVAATVLALLAVERAVIPGSVIVTIASTAFIVFVVPHSVAAQTRREVGGHAVGVLAGAAFVGMAAIPRLDGAIDQSRIIWGLVACGALGLGTFAMVATDTEHPPAAATCLALALGGWIWSSVAFILIGAACFSIIRLVLRRRLINLI